MTAGSGFSAKDVAACCDHLGNLRRSLEQRIPNRFRGLIATDDVIQEVLIQLVSAPQGSISDWRAWTTRAAQSVLKNAVRNAQAKKRGGHWTPLAPGPAMSSHIDPLLHLLADTPTPSRVFSARETLEAVLVAITMLPTDQGDAVRAVFLQGLTRAEAAVRLGKSESMVCKLVSEGMESLRDLLRDMAVSRSSFHALGESGRQSTSSDA